MNKQFEEWLLDREYWILDECGTFNASNQVEINQHVFNQNIPFSMQWGVYLSFFDSVGIYIDIDCDQYTNEPLQFSSFVNHNQVDYYKTRREAQQEAIKKAFDLLESK